MTVKISKSEILECPTSNLKINERSNVEWLNLRESLKKETEIEKLAHMRISQTASSAECQIDE